MRVGIPADSGVTADDAQRALNASLLAGDGPDVIVLDGLPLDRMAQQGMLLNLADARDLLLGSDSFYENILFGLGDASDYAVPTSFSLPVIEGSENLLDRFTTASDLVELVAVDPSAAEALGVDSGLSDLLAASYPAIVSHGTLDRRALSAFLENADTLLKAAQANYDRCQIALGEGGGDYDAVEYGIDALTTTAHQQVFPPAPSSSTMPRNFKSAPSTVGKSSAISTSIRKRPPTHASFAPSGKPTRPPSRPWAFSA